MWWMLGILGWIACSMLNFGMVFATFQGMFPCIAEKTKKSDYAISLLSSAFGPLSLIAILYCKVVDKDFRGHGFKWR